MPKFKFTYEVEADDIDQAYEIAGDNLGCFIAEELKDTLEEELEEALEEELEENG